jgi:ribonucleoside-triphosphate reductase
MSRKLKLSPYQSYIHRSRYARWVPEKNRRENLEETVDRYLKFFGPRIPKADRAELLEELREAILGLDVMGSMRAVMTAGEALEKDNCAGYNCSYIAVDDPRAFDEAMYISMCGTGVGFSVERQYVNKLPTIAEEFYPTETVIKVGDSKIGWASSYKQLIQLLYVGLVPSWDLSAIRPAGSPLKTFGGRASGPGPLEDLFKFTCAVFKKAAGRKLNSLECHDVMCKIADVVVSGGVRRSAMISLSNLSDDRMRNAKNGQWWEQDGQRALSNNSVAYTEGRPEPVIFLREMQALIESKSGERGMFSRTGAQQQAKRTGRRKWEGIEFGTNPCGEIILRPMGFCNLTEVVVRPEDTKASLKKKIRLATILGTLQSTLTDFRYLRKIWQKNAEEERLLGVSLTGIMDHPLLSTVGPDTAALLDDLRAYAVEVNAEWADKLGINPSASITCVKPSGTVSQLVNSSSGIHTRWSRYLMRTVRNDKKDPLGALLKAIGIPCEDDVTKPKDVDVFYFPLESPAGSVMRNDRTAIQQLELYLMYKQHWCEHNPSCTIYVKENEWLDVAAWIYKNFTEIGGVSFLPFSEHIYRQAPYQELTEAEYQKAVEGFPKEIDWTRLSEFETEDMTTNSKDLACSAGVCEIVGSAG